MTAFVIVIFSILFAIALGATSVLLIYWLYTFFHKDIKSDHGIRVQIDENMDYKIDEKEFNSLIKRFVLYIAGPQWDNKRVNKHLSKITLKISKGYLKNVSTLATGKIIGVTYSPKKIHIAITEDMVKNNKVMLTNTAILYELFNALIWKFEENGEYVVLAESFIPLSDSRRHFIDIDNNGVIDDKDVSFFKSKRAVLDEFYSKNLNKVKQF